MLQIPPLSQLRYTLLSRKPAFTIIKVKPLIAATTKSKAPQTITNKL